jgi:hypothetical protein
MTDVEMKETNAAVDTKVDAKAAEEPTDRFYGKPNTSKIDWVLSRAEKVTCFAGKGCNR